MKKLTLQLNGKAVEVRPGVSVAAVLFAHPAVAYRTSVTGQPREALCGMGACYECRVTIDGVPHRRACMTSVADGMVVVTGA